MQDFLAGELSCDEYEEIKTCCVRESERLKERILTLRGEQHRQSETPTVDNSWLKTFSGLQLPARLNRNLACAPIQRITIYAENKIDVIFKYQDEREHLLIRFTATSNPRRTSEPGFQTRKRPRWCSECLSCVRKGPAQLR